GNRGVELSSCRLGTSRQPRCRTLFEPVSHAPDGLLQEVPGHRSDSYTCEKQNTHLPEGRYLVMPLEPELIEEPVKQNGQKIVWDVDAVADLPDKSHGAKLEKPSKRILRSSCRTVNQPDEPATEDQI